MIQFAARATLLLCLVSGFSTLTLTGCGSAEAVESPTAELSSRHATLTSLDAEESRFLELINDYRQNNGLEPLSLSNELTDASHWMSEDMAVNDRFSHTDSQGQDPFVRMANFMNTRNLIMGENIAAGYSRAEATFEQWRTSPGHNANMLNRSYQRIGIGRAHNTKSGYFWYWTTDFAQDDNSKP
ncbi:MAG: CAP domain-containing protein [Methylotenera sp.]|nr:CAP domain-containing protein [Oligoflexia bacterium]